MEKDRLVVEMVWWFKFVGWWCMIKGIVKVER